MRWFLIAAGIVTILAMGAWQFWPARYSITITSPQETIECPDRTNCQFAVNGTSSGAIADERGIGIYVLVSPTNPSGGGWYPQIVPASIGANGTWVQSPAWLGDPETPVESGHTLQIVALAVRTPVGEELLQRIGNPIASLGEIDYETISNIVSLTVQ